MNLMHAWHTSSALKKIQKTKGVPMHAPQSSLNAYEVSCRARAERCPTPESCPGIRPIRWFLRSAERQIRLTIALHKERISDGLSCT